MLRHVFQHMVILFYIFGIECQNPEVEIPLGRLRGDTRNNIDGGTYYSFLSIPYGKPPVNELRFKASQPAEPWEGVRDATQDVPYCVQQGNLIGQEDCLYLNVYTPGLPAENVIRLPVMVWIHGGAFTSGAAIEMMYGAQYLQAKDVILVTINYRIGIFGFLTLDDPNLGVTGNAGMKDQVLALEWVRDNIQFFGGDPNNVLIFGQSAGSTSVQLLMLSPMANGLFHKAICQSGTALRSLLNTRNTGVIIADILGIQTEDWENMLISLQEASVNDLAMAELNVDTSYFEAFTAPIVEIPSDSAFLSRNPIDTIKSGDYNQVPLIIGVTDAEGLLYQYLSRVSTGESILIEDFTDFVPTEFNFEDGSILTELVALLIRFFYYGDEEPSKDNITQAINLATDFGFAFPSYRTAREYVKTAENPIYFYHFTAITDLSFFRTLDETLAAYNGAAHSDDIGYIFYILSTPSVSPGSFEDRVMRNMVELWTNFATYNNPTPEALSDFIWEPVKEGEFNYLQIGTEETIPVLHSVFTPDRMQFWWELYEEFITRIDI